jgi:hypothetical protein
MVQIKEDCLPALAGECCDNLVPAHQRAKHKGSAANKCPFMDRRRDTKGFSCVWSTREFRVIPAADILSCMNRTSIVSKQVLVEIGINATA